MSTPNTDASPNKNIEQNQITDNGSIVLGWMVIAVMLVLATFNVALYEEQNLESAGSTQVNIEQTRNQESLGQPVQDKPVIIQDEKSLIHTKLQI